MVRLAAGLAAIVAWAATGVVGEEWPEWRGPRRDGSSQETGLPLRWSESEHVAWKTPIPGKGHSSPIVWGDRVFVTTAEPKELRRILLCLDARDGKVLWSRDVLVAPLEKINNLNSYASSTPATDGRHVFVAFQDRGKMFVACYDFEGNKVWEQRPGKFYAQHGFCSSPLLYKDTIILNGDQDSRPKGPAYILALDKATGAERWLAPRPVGVRSYVPPVIFDVAGKKQLVLSGSQCVASYDPDTGKQIWIVDGPTEQMAASLVTTQGILFVTGGFPTLHLMGMRPDGEGNVTKTHVLWHEAKNPKAVSYVPSPLAHKEWFFVVSDGVVGGGSHASCIEAKTGKILWTEKLGRHQSASPVLADGLMYFPDDDGITWVVRAGPKFELVAKNTLGDKCFASFALSRGRIYIRGLKQLWCIGGGEKK
ncbi:MAG TPA: PQQ-binding-like beta-propeller repeat protein [Planctomycetota bacterium]|nr:PQQ-binding-like beta-propeller repeat protein [Planctomycetota bacterium]